MQTVASCVRCLKVYLTVLAHVKMKTIKNHLHCNVLNAFSGHNLYNFLWSGRELRMLSLIYSLSPIIYFSLCFREVSGLYYCSSPTMTDVPGLL